MEKKSRKTYKGEKNDKERTMGKLLLAVGHVLEEKGYTGLTISNIAKKAGVDRKLVVLYFGSLDNLVETYIKGKDYWISGMVAATAHFSKSPMEGSKGIIESLIISQMDNFMSNSEMQKALLWQISEKSNVMSQISREREKMSTFFFALADRELADKNVDIRAISGILVAAVYYLVLHSENTDSTVCEIDVKTTEGMDRIRAAIKQILAWTYTAEKAKG